MKVYFLAVLHFFFVFTSINCQTPKRITTAQPRPKPVPAPVQPKPTTFTFQEEMLAAVNELRTRGCKCGDKKMPAVNAIKWNTQLEKAAFRHANDMATHNHFDHVGTDGSEPDTRIEKEGYVWMSVGENIACGHKNLEEVIQGWIDSPSHCKQMMAADITEMGAAVVNNFWVQDFAKPME